MTELRFPEHPENHPLNQLPANVFKGSEFEAKLNQVERCSILAFRLCNVSVPQLAAAFGVNRRTVNKLVDLQSDKYKSVKDEYRRLGQEDFIATYATEAAAARIAAAVVKDEVEQVGREYDKASAERATTANKRASSNGGINNIKLPHHDYTHRIEVAWIEENTAVDDSGPFEHPAGWYWRDLDSDRPDMWSGDPDVGSYFTSAKALAHAKANC